MQQDEKTHIEDLKKLRTDVRSIRTEINQTSTFFKHRNLREKKAVLNVVEEVLDRMIIAAQTKDYRKLNALSREYETLIKEEFEAIFTDPDDGFVLLPSWMWTFFWISLYFYAIVFTGAFIFVILSLILG